MYWREKDEPCYGRTDLGLQGEAGYYQPFGALREGSGFQLDATNNLASVDKLAIRYLWAFPKHDSKKMGAIKRPERPSILSNSAWINFQNCFILPYSHHICTNGASVLEYLKKLLENLRYILENRKAVWYHLCWILNTWIESGIKRNVMQLYRGSHQISVFCRFARVHWWHTTEKKKINLQQT